MTPDGLLPRDFVDAARRTSRAQFVAEYGDTGFLLVRLDDPSGELARALDDASGAVSERLGASTTSNLGFSTGLANLAELAAAGPASRRRPKTAADVRALVERATYFVAPLRKRAVEGKPFLERISLGRARNNDVVLRDASVSKFHAWFELSDNGVLFVGDARSTNATLVNGVRVHGPLEPIASGDALRFGTIEALYLSAELLWDAIAPG